jgi:hypothetical protein
MGQGLLVLKHRAQIAHVGIITKQFAFGKNVRPRTARAGPTLGGLV